MEDKREYACEKCGQKVTSKKGKPAVSKCCNAQLKVIEKVPFCTTAPSAEQARADNEDDPCDDGRDGGV